MSACCPRIHHADAVEDASAKLQRAVSYMLPWWTGVLLSIGNGTWLGLVILLVTIVALIYVALPTPDSAEQERRQVGK